MARVSLVAAFFAAAMLATAGVAHAAFLPQEVQTIGVDVGPAAVVEDPGLQKIFVAAATSGTVDVIDEGTKSLILSTSVGPSPAGLALDPSNHRVFVAMGGTNRIAVLDGNTGGRARSDITIPQCSGTTGPWGIDVSPTSHTVYVACYSANAFVAVNPSTGAVTASTSTASGPLGVALDDAAGLVYVGHFGSPEIRVYNATTLALTARITNGISAGLWGVRVDPPTHRVFAANFNNGTLQTIVANRVTSTVAGFSGPEWIGVDSARDRVWVPEKNSFPVTRVTVVDATTGFKTPVLVSGQQPTAIAATASGYTYATIYFSGLVSVIFG